MRSRHALVLALVCACAREDGRADTPAPSAPPSVTPVAAAPPKTAAAPAGDLQAEVPGFPLDQVPPYVRAELVAAARDEFVYDGSPATLAGCLKDNLPCKEHAVRGLTIIASELAAGIPREQAIVNYNRYFGSFAKDKRRTIDLAGVPCKGNDKAPITLVEFADFQCGHCAQARLMLAQLVKDRSDVRVCFKHFPLGVNPHSHAAAQAAEFANQKGKFWEVHDALFTQQRELSNEKIKEIVKTAGLDPAELVKSAGTGGLAKIVDGQKAEGDKLGIDGTPTLFVNGRKLEVGLSPDMVAFTLQDELEWQKNGGFAAAAR